VITQLTPEQIRQTLEEDTAHRWYQSPRLDWLTEVAPNDPLVSALHTMAMDPRVAALPTAEVAIQAACARLDQAARYTVQLAYSLNGVGWNAYVAPPPPGAMSAQATGLTIDQAVANAHALIGDPQAIVRVDVQLPPPIDSKLRFADYVERLTRDLQGLTVEIGADVHAYLVNLGMPEDDIITALAFAQAGLNGA
jgi:hypothetical protein